MFSFLKLKLRKNQLAEYLEERAWMKINIEIDYMYVSLFRLITFD